MPLIEFIVSRLRELRTRHGLTQEQVAALLDADLRWYQRIELGAKDVRVSTVDRLAAVFGVSAPEFLALHPPKTKVQPPAPPAPHKPRRAATQRRKGARREPVDRPSGH